MNARLTLALVAGATALLVGQPGPRAGSGDLQTEAGILRGLLDDIRATRVTPAGPLSRPGGEASPAATPNVAFTPDGQQACCSFEDGHGLRLALVSTMDGAVVKASLVPQFARPGRPSISPDGSRLLFQTRQEKDPAHSGIWLTTLAGKAPRRVCPRRGRYSSPVWRPDGRAFACWREDGSAATGPAFGGSAGTRPTTVTSTLVLIDPAHPEAELRRLGKPGAGGTIQFSPDGKSVLRTAAGVVRVISAAGGDWKTVLDTRTLALANVPRKAWRSLSSFAWLPDSKRFVLTMRVDRSYPWPDRIFVSDLKGTARQLAEGRVLGGPLHGRILFVRHGDHNWRVELR